MGQNLPKMFQMYITMFQMLSWEGLHEMKYVLGILFLIFLLIICVNFHIAPRHYWLGVVTMWIINLSSSNIISNNPCLEALLDIIRCSLLAT